MRVPDHVRNCVAFVGMMSITPRGHQRIRTGGTAFFVSVPSQRSQGKVVYVYLVTAKHVAIHLLERDFTISLNNKEGTGGVHIHVPAEHAQWWFHPTDESVDVAVLRWTQPKTLYDPKIIPTSTFLTDEVIQTKNIGTGDEVFMAGLFAYLEETEKNLPIVRMGNIALMPDEPIVTRFGKTDAYLIEARSLGGLSGSPAFVYPWRGDRFYLLGLMHGHWDTLIEDPDVSMVQDAAGNVERVNVGIAIVVPAKKILEVLDHPELLAEREGY